MSEPRRILLVGATGLIGGKVMQLAIRRPELRLMALARREAPLPLGGRIEMLVAEPANWTDAIAAIAPDAVICALGTTWRDAGQDEAEFRAVDLDLVLLIARAAKAAGADRFVVVSSVGAAISAKQLYLRVKGEMEQALGKVGFRRLDILQPSLLRGPRSGVRRPWEVLAQMFSPLADLVLHGKRRRFRAIDADVVAAAALNCTLEKPGGRFPHEYDDIHRMAARLDDPRFNGMEAQDA